MTVRREIYYLVVVWFSGQGGMRENYNRPQMRGYWDAPKSKDDSRCAMLFLISACLLARSFVWPFVRSDWKSENIGLPVELLKDTWFNRVLSLSLLPFSILFKTSPNRACNRTPENNSFYQACAREERYCTDRECNSLLNIVLSDSKIFAATTFVPPSDSDLLSVVDC